MAEGTVTDLRGAQRVLCFGATGSGKSTAAALLGTALALPVTFVDDICWLPGWRQRPAAEQDEILTGLLGEPRWVFDTVYHRQTQQALARADVIIAMDYSRLRSLGRLLRRTVRRIVSGELVCNGNVETWRRALGRESIMRWHFRSWHRKRVRMRSWYADPSAPPVVLLRRPRELDSLLGSL